MTAAIQRLFALISAVPDALLLLLTRVGIGFVFWNSGRTKVDGFAIRPEAIDLFRDEYRLPLFAPEIVAPLAAGVEHLLPMMLFVGLGTRFAALGLFGMTMVIQILVYPQAWSVHTLWVAALGWLIVKGGGTWSIDQLIGRVR